MIYKIDFFYDIYTRNQINMTYMNIEQYNKSLCDSDSSKISLNQYKNYILNEFYSNENYAKLFDYLLNLDESKDSFDVSDDALIEFELIRSTRSINIKRKLETYGLVYLVDFVKTSDNKYLLTGKALIKILKYYPDTKIILGEYREFLQTVLYHYIQYEEYYTNQFRVELISNNSEESNLESEKEYGSESACGSEADIDNQKDLKPLDDNLIQFKLNKIDDYAMSILLSVNNLHIRLNNFTSKYKYALYIVFVCHILNTLGINIFHIYIVCKFILTYMIYWIYALF